MSITLRKKLAQSGYTLQSERDQPGASMFQLKPLNGVQKYTISGELRTNDAGKFVLTDFGVQKVLQWGLVGWSNVCDDQGTDVPFSHETSMNLDAPVIDELVNEIWNRSVMTEDERKNLSSQSKSSEIPGDTTAADANTDTTVTIPAPGPGHEDQPAS